MSHFEEAKGLLHNLTPKELAELKILIVAKQLALSSKEKNDKGDSKNKLTVVP